MKRIAYLILAILVQVSVMAGNLNMIVEHYTVEQGLPNNIIHCALKGKDGFVWFGTWYGLCSFDGVEFKTYNRWNGGSTAIPPQKIQKIAEDKNGGLWVKTVDRKLYVFDKIRECFYPVYDLLKEHTENTQIAKVEYTSDGDVLLSTMNSTLLRAYVADNGQIHIEKLYSPRSEEVNSSMRPEYNLFCETAQYISWIRTDRFQIVSHRKGSGFSRKAADFVTKQLPADRLQKLTCISTGNEYMWLGDQYGGVYSISLSTGAVQTYRIPGIEAPIRNLLFCSEKVLYISTDRGIFEYHIDSKILKRLSLGIHGGNVSHSFIDRYDKIWFHEMNSAIVYYDPTNEYHQRFEYKAGQKMDDFEVQDVGEHGLFFLTSTGELFMFDRETISMIPINTLAPFDKSGSSQLFYNLLLDKSGVLWVSSTTNGVYRINFPQKQFHLLKNFPAPPADVNFTDVRNIGVRALCQTRNGDIWAGTRWQEVVLLDRNGQIKKRFPKESGLFGSVYHILEDSNGTLWFSTKGEGLVRAEPDASSPHGFRFTRYVNEEANPNSLNSNDVYLTFEDSRHRIWVATLSGGLNLIEEKNNSLSFKHSQNGLKGYPSFGLYTEVRALVEDNEGRIWVGTMDGLMSFDSHFNQPEQIAFETYRNEKENSNILVNDVHTMYKDKESQIWISVFGGGINKLVRYNKKEREPEFRAYHSNGNIKNDIVMSIAEDNEGNLWLAAEDKLFSFNKKTEQFRSYDKYDGFPNVKIEENSMLLTQDGDFWLGCSKEIIYFSPKQLKNESLAYPIYIIDFKVSNHSLFENTRSGSPVKSIKYMDDIKLNHHQSMFTIEFAALNYHSPNHISYRYILEGYEDEWHYNQQNRVASYTRMPPGKYTFCVEALNETGVKPIASKRVTITILPPWWETGWAYTLYALVAAALVFIAVKFILFYLRVRNNLYIEQQMSEMKIKFFTNVSHELRTPLTLIKTPMQELKARERFTGKSLEYIELMERSANQMLQLVNQILDFRKMQHGKMRLRISEVDISELLESFYQEFHILAEENGIDYQVDIPQLPVRVWADSEKLSMALRNVIANAFKFTPEGGAISVTVAASEDENRYYIRIKDSGIGIPADKLTRVFEHFVQGESPVNSAYSGTGIGLAFSKEIIALHHGKIKAESPQQQGAVFIIELLAGKEHFAPSEVDFYVGDRVKVEAVPDVQQFSPDEQVADPSLPTLLLADDNKDLRKLIQLQLEKKYNIYLAGNGVEALRKTYLYHPDLIITDQMMPGMSGLELLKRIREDEEVSHIPVIILTAKNDEEIKTQAISLGANSYITKPFNKDYLQARIDQLLNEQHLAQ